jgi:putative NIF3 family GTP cyclohydrolase 1 type 2
VADTEKATTVIARLLARLGAAGKPAEYEGFCAGDPELPVSRAVCCFSPTVEVLRRASDEKWPLVIAREHPFYTHGTFYASGTEAALKDDPVARAKRELIARGGLVVYRLSSLWDRAKPGAQAAALAEALGWRPEPAEEPRRHVVCRIPATSLGALAANVERRLGARTVRGVGDRHLAVSRVAVLTGYVDVPACAAAARDAQVDAVIAGDACEWEGAEYLKDLVDSGRKFGVLYAGFTATELPGAEAIARWLGSALPGLEVSFFFAPEPSRLP